MRYAAPLLAGICVILAGCASTVSSDSRVDEIFSEQQSVQTPNLQQRASSFMAADWGSTRQEVHLAEDGQLTNWNEKTVLYQEKIEGQMYMRKYAFADDSLVAATRFPIPDMSTSKDLMSRMSKLHEMEEQKLRELGRPDIVDASPELSLEHYGWNGKGVYAIAEVEDNGGANIWYGKGQLGKELQKPDALREELRKTIGYLEDDTKDLPADLQENPSMSVKDRLVVSRDKMEGRTIYRDPSTGRNESGDELSLFIVDEEGAAPQLALKKTYSASDWLFINRMNALVDGERFEISNIGDKVNRETVHAGDIKETYTTSVEGEIEDMVRAIANADEATIRLTGRSSYRDIQVTEREKRAMRNVLAMYDQLLE